MSAKSPLQIIPGGRAGKRLILDQSDPLSSARAFVAAFHIVAELRTLHHHRGAFYEFDGACYRMVDSDGLRARIWTFLSTTLHRTAAERFAPYKPNRARVGDVTEATAAVCILDARIQPPVWLTQTDMRPPDEFLAVANGLLHLPSGDLYPATPELFNLAASPVRFDEDASEPHEWLRFLADLWPDDREAIQALQEWFGYCLTCDTSQQKILLVVGPKRSGKGTITRVLTGMLGQDSVVGPTLAGLSRDFGLEPLIGKPVAIIADARLGNRADPATISERLLSISGEDALTVDRKYLSAWTGRLPTRFMVLTNELPRVADASGALTSRFIVLTMQRSFYGREDPKLASRLLDELPGILKWARDGYLSLRERGHFEQPTSARDAVDRIEALGSPITAFTREKCTVDPDGEIGIRLLFETWCKWCVENGRKDTGTAQTFGRDLHAAIPELKTKRGGEKTGNRRLRVYRGLRLKTDAERERELSEPE